MNDEEGNGRECKSIRWCRFRYCNAQPLHSKGNVVTEMKAAAILASLALAGSLLLPQEQSGWRGIVPLHSTRTQVERLIGVLDIQCQCYSTETEIIRVKYSHGPCKGDSPGWNVPTDTVLSFEVVPKNRLVFRI